MLNQGDVSTSTLLNSAKQSILHTAVRPDIVMERGSGMYLWDTDGNKYLDFIGGWAVACLGHSPAVIKEALERQSATLLTASPAFYNRAMIEFSNLLVEISCFDKVFFASSGAEANESAIKLARKYGSLKLNGAYEIITANDGFHGRTLATMSATGKAHWKQLFAPKVPGFKHVPLNDLEAIRSTIDRNTCAIMLELVQGEGGVNPVDPVYLHKLRELCNENNILLIFDEIQNGIGRTGKLFAYQHYGVEADIMTLGKGIGGGFPLSAMLTKEAYNLFEPGDQGGTYCGQPLAMAVGNAVVNEVIHRELPLQAEVQGHYIMKKLHQIKENFQLQNIRGLGLLIAFDLPQAAGSELVSQCLSEGLLINSPNPRTIRLMPPLIVTKAEVDRMIEILSISIGKTQRK
jgi:acetylornithine/N-succinyldiaminopimelate aminotransferase